MKKLIIVLISVLLFAVVGFSVEWHRTAFSGTGLMGTESEIDSAFKEAFK